MNRYYIFLLNTRLLSKGSKAAHLVVVVFLQALYNMLLGTLPWIGRRLDWLLAVRRRDPGSEEVVYFCLWRLCI